MFRRPWGVPPSQAPCKPGSSRRGLQAGSVKKQAFEAGCKNGQKTGEKNPFYLYVKVRRQRDVQRQGEENSGERSRTANGLLRAFYLYVKVMRQRDMQLCTNRLHNILHTGNLLGVTNNVVTKKTCKLSELCKFWELIF